MAESAVPITVIDQAGNAVPGAQVTIRRRSDSSVITMKDLVTGSPLSTPQPTNSQGRLLVKVDDTLGGELFADIDSPSPLVDSQEHFDVPLRLSDTGQLVLGTGSPSAKLHVKDDIATTAIIENTGVDSSDRGALQLRTPSGRQAMLILCTGSAEHWSFYGFVF